jgi:hypothetical protein
MWEEELSTAVTYTALVIVGLIVLFGLLIVISARFKQRVTLQLEAVKRPIHVLQKTHPDSWRLLSRVLNALCRCWMFIDMALDGALCIALYNDKVGETNPGLWSLSLLVWMLPYICLWMATFNIFWEVAHKAWVKKISFTKEDSTTGSTPFIRNTFLFCTTLMFGLPGVLVMDILFVTVFLFADFAHTEYLVHYERLRYLVEAMVEGPLGLIFQIFVLLKSSREESGIVLDPLLLPFSIMCSVCSIMYQIASIRTVAANTQTTFLEQLKTVWKVGVGSLPYVDGIASGRLQKVHYNRLDLVPHDIRVIVHAIHAPAAALTSLSLSGCGLNEHHLIELERLYDPTAPTTRQFRRQQRTIRSRSASSISSPSSSSSPSSTDTNGPILIDTIALAANNFLHPQCTGSICTIMLSLRSLKRVGL